MIQRRRLTVNIAGKKKEEINDQGGFGGQTLNGIQRGKK